MTFIVNQPRYTPVGVVPFSLVKPSAPADDPSATDLYNSELEAIRDAFRSLSSLPSAVSVALTASSRNALVNLSSLIDTDTSAVITLPEFPNVGDPPCVIEVVASGYRTVGSFEAAAIITTTLADDQTLINGVLPDNVSGTNLLCLYNPGDRAVCVYAGPDIGWQTYLTISTVTNPIGFSSPAGGSFPGPWQKSVLKSAVAVYDLSGITQVGQWFAMTNSAVGTVTLGDATYTFNGVIGPYAFSDRYVEHLFVMTAAKTFSVS